MEERTARLVIPARVFGDINTNRVLHVDENVTEDEYVHLPRPARKHTNALSFYGGPLQGIFNTLRRRHILQDVQTLILDGLSVTSDLLSDLTWRWSWRLTPKLAWGLGAGVDL